MNTKNIKVIAFDADDTLWDCQGHFERVMQHLYDELTPWVDRQTAALELFSTERKNMPLLGYGVKAFTLSMLETAMRVSRNEMPAAIISQTLQECYSLLEFPCTPLPEVEQTLKELRQHVNNHDSASIGLKPQLSSLVVFTKGELLDQQHKLQRSGLQGYFDHVEITSDKGEAEFIDLCRKLSISPKQMLMVGNSLRSDIAPALAVDCQAVYIPFHVTWQLEHHEHFDHPQMAEIEHFGQLLTLLSE